MMRNVAVAVTVVAMGVMGSSTALAGQVPVATGFMGGYTLPVTSMKEARFRATIKQQYDYSCGSAALATLLTYHYEHPVSEQDVFRVMYEHGNQKKIRAEGFSLLDMKRYLEAQDYRADGFYASLDKLGKVGVPAIALIETDGYKHFVVIKGITDRQVVLGDPSAGAVKMSREAFVEGWDGLVFIIRNKADIARSNFNHERDWDALGEANLGLVLNHSTLANVTWLRPGRNDF